METAIKPQRKNALTKFLATKQKIDRLLTLDKIGLKDIEDLSKAERDYLGEIATEKLNQLKDAERDSFIAKIECVIPLTIKNDMCEHNHLLIGNAITSHLCQYGCMPPKVAIAKDTGLSRQTVIKHLSACKTHPEQLASIEQFKFMAPRVMASVFKAAVKGDTKAARLYFEMIADPQPQSRAHAAIGEQNNYIQINNTILSQENLSKLTEDQLNQIEQIVKAKEV